MSYAITALGPRLSQAAMDRLSYEVYRPKAQGDEPGVEAAGAKSTADGGASEASPNPHPLPTKGLVPNEGLLSSLPMTRFEALVGSLTSPPPPPDPRADSFVGDRYEEDVWPAFVKNMDDMPTVGFPKGVHQGSSRSAEEEWEAQRQRQEEIQKQNEAYQKANEESQRTQEEADRADKSYANSSVDDDFKMPDPDSGDPGGPRTLDPYLYQPQPMLSKAIAEVAIR